MSKKETSIYHVYGNVEKMDIPKNTKEWGPECKDGSYQYGISILKTLNYYTVLNKSSILKQTYHGNEWKRNMLPKILKNMRGAGVIDMYCIKNPRENENDLVFYMLSGEGKKILEENEIEVIGDGNEEELLKETALCLRRLALNQWHINLNHVLADKVKEAYYRAFCPQKGFVTPSLIKYSMTPLNKSEIGQNMSLFAYIAPYDNKGYVILMEQIIKTYEFLVENDYYRPALIVVLCENTSHASYTSWKLNHVREMRPINTLIYALDLFTNKEKMLSFLYSCDMSEEGIVKSNIILD